MARHSRLKTGAALLALASLAGCFAAVVPVPLDPEASSSTAATRGRTISASSFTGPWDAVSFEIKSWGHPVSSWRVLPDGSGSWIETERDESTPLERYRLARHDLPADAARAARLRGLIDALPFPAPSSDDCASFITDQPYGSLKLEKRASVLELTYNAGCLDDAYRPFIDGLRAADEVVSDAGRAFPVARREDTGASE